ncbi:hypothetical protein RSOLAG22IIIB_12473 [Rhizoctonia solani]|uniref:Uncharacterized protein n=1 Tax=Rhizoctonia solani TaxID=456999 RepID=A0A0K6GEJ2_9AGAM|nr:hypothetical protein RSOLAG22IIIB_12473 [Rhizoctonia solani]
MMNIQDPSNGYTYLLRYAKDINGQSCATRAGPDRPIELHPRVPELVDLQGWAVPRRNDEQHYQVLDPTTYSGKQYGLFAPRDPGLQETVMLGSKPSEFRFMPEQEKGKYIICLSGPTTGGYKCLDVLNNQLVIHSFPEGHMWDDLPRWYLDPIAG